MNQAEKLAKVGVVAGVVLKRNGKYLLVQEKKPRAYGLWNLPAGKVDEGYGIEETAIKEAKEESGFDVRLIREISIYHINIHEPVKHAFEAEIIGGELAFPEDELLDARWFSYEEIIQLEAESKLRGEWVLDTINRARGNNE